MLTLGCLLLASGSPALARTAENVDVPREQSLSPAPRDPILAAALVVFVESALILAFVGARRRARDLSRKPAEAELRMLNRRLVAAQEEERHRIARELHDHLSQQLALLAIDLQQLSSKPPASDEGLAVLLKEAWARTAEIASDVHAISHRLHPSKLEALGLAATARGYCRDMSRQGLEIRFADHTGTRDVPPDVALCLFRVLEEAVGNVVSHSGATEADVRLFDSKSDIVLRVADRGRGFAPEITGASGLGLISMRERVGALGGYLSVVSSPGAGTIIEARVPSASAFNNMPEVPHENVVAVA